MSFEIFTSGGLLLSVWLDDLHYWIKYNPSHNRAAVMRATFTTPTNKSNSISLIVKPSLDGKHARCAYERQPANLGLAASRCLNVLVHPPH